MFKKSTTIFYSFLFLISPIDGQAESIDNITKSSSPKEIVNLLYSDGDELIAGIVHPLTGNLAYSPIDVIANGAQPIVVQRHFRANNYSLPLPISN